jgi:hypothetical protein
MKTRWRVVLDRSIQAIQVRYVRLRGTRRNHPRQPRDAGQWLHASQPVQPRDNLRAEGIQATRTANQEMQIMRWVAQDE